MSGYTYSYQQVPDDDEPRAREIVKGNVEQSQKMDRWRSEHAPTASDLARNAQSVRAQQNGR